MNELEKYHDPMVDQDVVDWQMPPEPEGESTSDLLAGIMRRWYIVLFVFILLCAVGVPGVWIMVEPQYEVVGAVRIDPVIADIVTGLTESGEISDYERFMNTEAEKMTSSAVIQRVADGLMDKDLNFFKNEPRGLIAKWKAKLLGPPVAMDPALKLKRAVVGGQKIEVAADRHTELIKVTMRDKNPKEAQQIVDAFIKAYTDIGVVGTNVEENQRLAILERERDALAETIKNYRQTIREFGEEFGSLDLGGIQQAMRDRVASLQDNLNSVEADRIRLEAEVQFLENSKEQPTMAQEDMLQLRQAYINSDPAVTAYAEDIIELERELVVAKQTYSDSNPEIQRKQEQLNKLKERLKELRQEASDTFDEMARKEAIAAVEKMLNDKRNELAQTKAHEDRLRQTLSEVDTEKVETGRKQLDIDDVQTELTLAQETYDRLQASIQDLELQRKRPRRISVYRDADIAGIEDKRVKFSIAVVLGAIVCGLGLAYLRDRADQCLRTPDDVAKRIGIRIIGTTTSLNAVKPAFLPEQIVGDYQTIRANLKLLGGNTIPKKLVITSPGMGEGKTTFAVNLATSMAESGLKVLLIDGDLRKPDVARLLNLPDGSRGLQDVLCGIKFDRAVYSVAATGLDVLAADFTDATDAYELLAQPSTARIIDGISRQYDHVIIDTPPVLGFPDALMWAKIGSAAILISYAGQTTMPDLREAKERLAQINVKVLGTVLSSVQAGHGYYRHGQSYYVQIRDSAKVSRRKLMFSVEEDEGDLGIEAPGANQSTENYSYADSTETRKAVVRTRKKASVSRAKGSDNNESKKRTKKSLKKEA